MYTRLTKLYMCVEEPVIGCLSVEKMINDTWAEKKLRKKSFKSIHILSYKIDI